MYLLAAMSPGPAVFYVMRTAVASRALGRLGALGVATGTTIWVIVAALGLAAALKASPFLSGGIRLAGGAYLLYIAVKLGLAALERGDAGAMKGFAPKNAKAAYAQGLATNVTNPGTALFFTGLLSLYHVETMPSAAQAAVYAGIPILSMCWYGTLALTFSNEKLARGYLRLRRPLDASLAVLFVALGAKLVLTVVSAGR